MIALWWLLQTASAQEWGPWDDRWAPVGDAPGVVAPPPVGNGVLDRAWRAYRKRSAADGAHCPYYPTCSGYGRTAVRTWGLVPGSMLTLDRLLREYWWMDKVDDYPLITRFGTPRLLDPVPTRRKIR